jgi:hypothetical protein
MQLRIQAQPPTGRVVRTINLDTASERDVAQLVADVADTDLVVMIVSAGRDAQAAAVIGEACSARRVMTHTAVVRAEHATDEALSRTLAQVRPWSLMIVVADDDHYVNDILKSFR